MPDVKIWTSFDTHHVGGYTGQLAMVIAREMSCEVDGEWYDLSPAEIDFPVIGRIAGPSGSSVIVEVAAYDFPNRVADIDQRIRNIAEELKKILRMEQYQKVSITFIPVQQKHWITA